MQKNGESYEKGMIAMDNNGYALEIRDVSKRFGGIVATNHANIKVKQGQIFGIIGPNGAGKTTLFNMITGVSFVCNIISIFSFHFLFCEFINADL